MTCLRSLSLCLVLLCASAVAASPRVDCDDPRETLRIQTWLSGVETFLRSRDVSHLTAPQRERRALHLSHLQAYRVAGRFPHNHVTRELTPVFIDEHGTACAVGQLLLQGGAPGLAHQIARDHLLARLPELDSPALKQWARENGFTLEELALIQPSYHPDSYPPVRVCLETTPTLFRTAPGGWEPLESPVDRFLDGTEVGVEFPWLASNGANLLWLISRHGEVHEWVGASFLPRTRLTHRELVGAAALPTSPVELMLALPPERASPFASHRAAARRKDAETFEGGVQPELYSLWRERGVGTVFGVGRDGRIFRRTPYESWVALSSPTKAPLLSLDGSGPADLWAVGGGGTALHFDGAGWSRVETRTPEGLLAVKAAAPDDVWAVGTRGTALHFDGRAWSAIPTGVTSTLRAVSVRGDEVWLGGDDGVILHRQGGAWTREDVPTPASVTSFGAMGDTVFAATNAQVGCARHLLVKGAVHNSRLITWTVSVLKALHLGTAGGLRWTLIGGMALLAALPLLVLLALGWQRSRRKVEVQVCLGLLLLSLPGAFFLHTHLSWAITFGRGITPTPAELTRMQDWLLLEHDLSTGSGGGGERPSLLAAAAARDKVTRFIQTADTLTSPRELQLRERYARLLSTGPTSPFEDESAPRRSRKTFGQDSTDY